MIFDVIKQKKLRKKQKTTTVAYTSGGGAERQAAMRSTRPCIPPGSLNRVPASAEVRAGMSPLPGGR